MNAMSSKFTTLCNHVVNYINASTTVDPYTSSHVIKCLEMEQQLLNSEKQRQTSLTATYIPPFQCEDAIQQSLLQLWRQWSH
jgi:hypothetical protein